MSELAGGLHPDGDRSDFFRGPEHVRLDRGRVDDGHPSTIADGRPGVFPDGVDAALLRPGGPGTA